MKTGPHVLARHPYVFWIAFFLSRPVPPVGFPKDLGFRNTKSLGLQLVNTLVAQLEGTIELDRGGGTEFRIAFTELT